MPLASDIQKQACIALENGAVYALRHAQSGTALRVSPCGMPVKGADGGAGTREAQTQKWYASSIGAEWTLQDVETGQFLGVEKREIGARVIMKYNATAWSVVPDEQDSKNVRLVLPVEGHHVGLSARGFPELVADQADGGTSDGSNMASFSKRLFAWRISECLTISAEGYVADSSGTTGWVSSLLSLSSA
ncbi:hypothetical protein GY45DRAFT_604709 [Cubamyces sp. BRFM 1775]|nr:hypothetical protein GY45DRAFT_604709 [Cubamyces sp. BRFM 1775]